MPRYVDLVAQLAPTLRALLTQPGQPAPTIDEGRLEQCLFHALQHALTLADLDAFTVFDTALFTTQTGVRTYALPSDFGRLLNYREPRQTGVRLNDGTTEAELWRDHVLDFVQAKSTSNGRPGRFILTSGGVTLDPAPDSNGSVGYYTVRATYSKSLDFNTFDMTSAVLLQSPHALMEAAQAHYLGQDMTPALSRLVALEGRQKVELQFQYTPNRWRRWRRRGRR
jgi:hypothetical protein